MNIIKDVEIFATGTHNGETFTDKDLQEIVDATNALDFKPAIKVGHTDDSALPAFGYVENFRKVGNKIIGDFTNLTQEVYESIKQKRFGRVSVELYKNLRRDGKVFKKALGAVALLGQSIPGVSGLKPLYEMFKLESDGVLTFEFATGIEQVSQSENNIGSNKMDDQLKLVQADAASLKAQLDSVKAESLEFKAQAEASKAAIKKLEMALFEKDVKEKTEKLPVSIRPFIVGLYAMTKPEAKTFSLKIGDKTEEVSQEVLIEKFSEFLASKFANLISEKQEGKPVERAESEYDSASDEVDRRVTTYQIKNAGVSYADAMKAVFAADPALKQAYAEEGATTNG